MGCRCAKSSQTPLLEDQADNKGRLDDVAKIPEHAEPEPEHDLDFTFPVADALEPHEPEPAPPVTQPMWRPEMQVTVKQVIHFQFNKTAQWYKLPPGLKGVVIEVDSVGDAFVEWERYGKSWLFANVAHKVTVSPPDARQERRSQPMVNNSSQASNGRHGRTKPAMRRGNTVNIDTVHQHLEQLVALRVMPFSAMEELGHLPRSSKCVATLPDGSVCGQRHDQLLVEVTEDWDLDMNPIVMISHSWIEPSKGRPDRNDNHKFDIVRRGIRRLCQEHDLEPHSMFIFLDWCSIDQESFGTPQFAAYVNSLPAFIAQMSFVLIPLDANLVMEDKLRLDEEECPVLMNWAHYSKRGWCRLEMLAGRALAAMGTQMRVYRFDSTWGPGKERLIEVPPYTPGSLGIMPTASDALFTCCQCDHWNPKTGKEMLCDRKAVKELEDVFSTVVRNVTGTRRSELLVAGKKLLAVRPELKGIVAVPATDFLTSDVIPRGGMGEGLGVALSDSDLINKRLFCFAHRWWRPGKHPDIPTNLKMRWMKKVLKTLVDQEGISWDSVYVWNDYSSMDQDDTVFQDLVWESLFGIIARATYFVVFETDENGWSNSTLDLAWIRRCVFISRLLFSRGIYTATYVTRLCDLDSLVGMTLGPLKSSAIDPQLYPTEPLLEHCIPEDGPEDGNCNFNCETRSTRKQAHPDALCPWAGRLGKFEDREVIRLHCQELLKVATDNVDDEQDLRADLVRGCQNKVNSIVSKHTNQKSV